MGKMPLPKGTNHTNIKSKTTNSLKNAVKKEKYGSCKFCGTPTNIVLIVETTIYPLCSTCMRSHVDNNKMAVVTAKEALNH